MSDEGQVPRVRFPTFSLNLFSDRSTAVPLTGSFENSRKLPLIVQRRVSPRRIEDYKSAIRVNWFVRHRCCFRHFPQILRNWLVARRSSALSFECKQKPAGDVRDNGVVLISTWNGTPSSRDHNYPDAVPGCKLECVVISINAAFIARKIF